MRVQRTNEEVIIKLSGDVDIRELQGILDYIRYKEITSRSKKVNQTTITKLSREVNARWWKKNKQRFLNESSR